MRGRKAKAYYWYSKETALETFSCKNKEQKSTRLGEQGLIYKITFFFFTSIFAIFLAFRRAYMGFIKQLDKLDMEKSRTSRTRRQFHQKNKRDIQAADTQSSPNQKNIIPHRSAEQETASRLLSQEPAQKQIQRQQQQQSQQDQQGQQSNQQNQNENVLTRETKPTAGRNRQTR